MTRTAEEPAMTDKRTTLTDGTQVYPEHVNIIPSGPRNPDGKKAVARIGTLEALLGSDFAPLTNAALRSRVEALDAELTRLRAENEALREGLARIKIEALTMGAPGRRTVARGLSHITRICIDAGVTEKLDELEARQLLGETE